jgi:PAS domain S-box-containing protein
MPDRTFSGAMLLPLALFAAVLAAGGLAYDAALRRGLRARAHDELQAVAELQVGIVSRWIAERSSDVEAMAGSPAVADVLTDFPVFGREEIVDYLRSSVIRHAYERAVVFDARGDVLFATADRPIPPAALAIARGTMGSGLAETSDLYAAGTAIEFYAAAPVVVRGRIRGAVLIVVDATRTLLPVVERWPTASRTAEVVLVEETVEGIRFVSRPRHVPEDLGHGHGGDLASLSDQAAELRSSDLLTGADYRGVAALGVARPVPGTPWIVLAKVDAAEALDEGAARAAIVAVVGALLVAAAAALAYALERSRRRALRVRYEAEQARARAEAEARRAAEERQRVLDAVSDAVFGVAPEPPHRVTSWNAGAERLYGFTAAEAIGRPAAEITPTELTPERIVQVARELAEDGATYQVWRQRRRDGSALQVESQLSMVRDDAGRPLVVAAVNRDVTERNAAVEALRASEEQLVLADRMASLGRLAAGVAHEINNPLTYVVANLGFAEGALGELAAAAAAGAPVPPALAAELREAIAEARGGTLRVRDIVRDLKTFSRGDDGAHGQVDLRRVVESCVAMARSEIRHRARLALDLAALPPIAGNEAKLGQVVLNLLVNAAQAIPEGAVDANEIRVTLAAAGSQEVAIEVRDTGCGVDPADLRRIFDPFFTTKPVGQGTGLGLAISHRIVADAGGRIDVETDGRRGTTFRVTLPRRVPASPIRADATAPASPVRRRIVVVDDEPSLATAVRRILSRHHDVTTFLDPREALRHLGANRAYDVLLCDVLMPGMTGLELHAQLRTIAPRLASATVLMTGGAFTPQTADALAASPLPRLEKPFSPEQLLAAVSARAAA